MPVCTIDNPKSMRRECWKDGEIIVSYSFDLFCVEPFPIPAAHFFFGANVGGWKAGRIVGDSSAMNLKDKQ